MPDLGLPIYSIRDDEGEIHVYQDRRFRYLTFGNTVEQSCLDLASPRRLEHVYTQAMMLALVLQGVTRTALLLGLGGGSLARALRAADRGLRITCLERRAAVIGVARSHFGLPEDRRCMVECAEAEDFLMRPGPGYELILADLYLAEGMYPRQVAGDFLALCRGRLGAGGILVINQWASEYQANRTASAALNEVFGEKVLQLHVQGGNVISFAFREALPDLQRKEFFETAQALGLRLDIPLQRHARNLWRQNAQILGTGRFSLRRG